MLADRRDETAALDRVLGAARDGMSGALVVRGVTGALHNYLAPEVEILGRS